MDKRENNGDVSARERSMIAKELLERTSTQDYTRHSTRILSARDMEDFYKARIMPFDATIRLDLHTKKGDAQEAVRFYSDGGQYERKKTCGGIGIIGLDSNDNIVCVARASVVTKNAGFVSTTDIETLGVMLCGYINARAIRSPNASILTDCAHSVNVAKALLPDLPPVTWVKGHAMQDHGNTCADALARVALDTIASQVSNGIADASWRGSFKLRTVSGISFMHQESMVKTNASSKNDSPDIYILPHDIKEASMNYAIIYANRANGRIFKMDSGCIMTTEGNVLQALASIVPKHRDGTKLLLTRPLMDAVHGEDDAPDAVGFKTIMAQKGHTEFLPNDAFRNSIVEEVSSCRRDSALMTLLRAKVTPAFRSMCFSNKKERRREAVARHQTRPPAYPTLSR